MAFCHLQKKLENKYGKKLMDTATKTGLDAAKTASKKVVQKTAEATGKEDETEEIYIPPEKRQQIIDDLRLF